jgi:hypothetical protein
MSNTVDVVIPMDKDDLWSNVFGSFEGVQEWWLRIDYKGDTTWQKHGLVKLTVMDGEDKPLTKEVTINDLARAYGQVIKKGYHHCGGPVNIEDMDECASDILLQEVMFGDVIYG